MKPSKITATTISASVASSPAEAQRNAFRLSRTSSNSKSRTRSPGRQVSVGSTGTVTVGTILGRQIHRRRDRVVPGIASCLDRAGLLRLPGLLIEFVTLSQVGVEFVRSRRNHAPSGRMHMSAGTVLEQHHRELIGRHDLGESCSVERVAGGVDLEFTGGAKLRKLWVSVEPIEQLLTLGIAANEQRDLILLLGWLRLGRCQRERIRGRSLARDGVVTVGTTRDG